MLMISNEDDSNHLDDLTRQKFLQGRWDESGNKPTLIDSTTGLAFMFGIFVGIILASLLHKYIVHPLGW